MGKEEIIISFIRLIFIWLPWRWKIAKEEYKRKSKSIIGGGEGGDVSNKRDLIFFFFFFI